ncbi:MAG: cadherin-like beta sandwich domain-containing protein [Fibrobacterota bacterium]|nr:cadherin-like beta sandwich domain-containing protein [Fibrobacterota bacterium]
MNMTHASALRFLFAFLVAAMAVLFSGCQTVDPPPAETILRLHLNDSLSRYEKVRVQLLDRNDTNKVIAVLHDGVLKNPANEITGYALGILAGKSFIVKVTAFLAQDRLALQTHIFYDAGKKTVRHDGVPPLQSLNWLVKLTPSVGVMSPVFHQDSLGYKVTIPAGIAAIALAPQAYFNGAVVSIDGATIPFGASSQPIQIGATSDTVTVLVSDATTGKVSTRTYTLILIPTPPAGLNLATLVPTAGNISPAFEPTTLAYTVSLPVGIDTVAFFVTPVDPKTMTLTISGLAYFSGKKSQVFTLYSNRSLVIPIEVKRGSELVYYQIMIDRATN